MDLQLQAELSARLLIAAALGAVIGAEREIHEHPAGMRTHLLVAFGCALFTVISIYGFLGGPAGTAPVDPSRVAAQIVTGIGFLGAGAILKYGTSIRGLTTAASLWATAAIGLGVGAGQWLLGIVGAAIVLLSLWPLHRLTEFLRMRNAESVRVRLLTGRLDALADISKVLHSQRVHIEGVQMQRSDHDRYELELDLRVPAGLGHDVVITMIDSVDDVQLMETDRAVE
jgi:putative Mg2+ transporter-C (MgtC) family protein